MAKKAEQNAEVGTKSVQLTDKQFNSISQIQAQKQVLTNQFNDLNQRENTIIELVLEFAGIKAEDVKSVKMEAQSLVLELK